jgi:hypothetical protein
MDNSYGIGGRAALSEAQQKRGAHRNQQDYKKVLFTG